MTSEGVPLEFVTEVLRMIDTITNKCVDAMNDCSKALIKSIEYDRLIISDLRRELKELKAKYGDAS